MTPATSGLHSASSDRMPACSGEEPKLHVPQHPLRLFAVVRRNQYEWQVRGTMRSLVIELNR